MVMVPFTQVNRPVPDGTVNPIPAFVPTDVNPGNTEELPLAVIELTAPVTGATVKLTEASDAWNATLDLKVCAAVKVSEPVMVWPPPVSRQVEEADQAGVALPSMQLPLTAPPIAAIGNEAAVAFVSVIEPGVPRADAPVNVGAGIVSPDGKVVLDVILVVVLKDTTPFKVPGADNVTPLREDALIVPVDV